MKPILLDLPTQIITNRLCIRPPQAGDGAACNEAIKESFEFLHQWMPWAKTCPELNDTEEYARQASAKWILRESLTMWIWDRKSSQFMGATGFHNINWQVPCFEIGYWLRRSKQGEGFMTEAVNALTRYAFLVLKASRVEIRCDQDNLKSASIPERLGFKLDVILEKNGAKPDGQIRNTSIYSILSSAGLPDIEVSW